MNTRTPRRIDQVVPGYYRYRRVKGGPWLPAFVSIEHGMIFVTEADAVLRVGIAFKAYEDLVVNAVIQGEAFYTNLLRVLWMGEPISLDEYEHLIAVMRWAKANHPEHPLNHPDKPIRLSEVPVKSMF